MPLILYQGVFLYFRIILWYNIFMLNIIKTFLIEKELVSIIKKIWNVDIFDFKHIIDSDGINHVINRHGKISKEKPSNFINQDDLDLIENIVKNADDIVAGGLSGTRKLPTVMYIKYLNDYKYYYIEEILKSKKELRIKTFYKNKIMKK